MEIKRGKRKRRETYAKDEKIFRHATVHVHIATKISSEGVYLDKQVFNAS